MVEKGVEGHARDLWGPGSKVRWGSPRAIAAAGKARRRVIAALLRGGATPPTAVRAAEFVSGLPVQDTRGPSFGRPGGAAASARSLPWVPPPATCRQITLTPGGALNFNTRA